MPVTASARSALTTSRAWLDGRFVERVDALVADVCADRRPATRVLALGVDDVLLERLRDRFGPALTTDRASADGVDLVVAVGVLAAAADPSAELRALEALTSQHLLLAEPRALVGRRGGRSASSWTMPGLQRLVSEVLSVRQVATPPPWVLLWAVRV